ncbi:hypothetical protein [Kosakonia sp. YIM B13611]|uniref:hypothetical protein n=1 Tax=unclassified Kosakonia TaxID=2632876 RepID=UPI0036902CAC
MFFSDEMVRAILDGRKTQTRRIMKVQPKSNRFGLLRISDSTKRNDIGKYHWAESNATGTHARSKLFSCPYGDVGDRIWVRETFSCIGNEDGHPVDAHGNLCSREDAQRIYRASAIHKPNNYGLWTSQDGFDFEGSWTPSIHMPRWASRITLEITGVGVQRLQSISPNDATREGLFKLPATGRYCLNQGDQYFGGASHDARKVFSWLWESIYGEESWQANPWVWVIEFKHIEGGA